jgi:hypothetical protein
MGAFTGEEGVLCTLFSIIINESCASDSKLRSKAIGLYFSIYAFGGVIIGAVTYILDDSWWLYLSMVCLSALTFIPVPFLALEPVKQLYKRGKVSDLFRVLHLYSQRNKTNLTMEEIQVESGIEEINLELAKCKLEHITTWREKLTLVGYNFKMLVFGGYLVRALCFIVVSGVLYTVFYAVTYNSGKIGLGSISLDVIFLAGIEAICYLGTVPFIGSIRRNKTTFCCQLLVLIGGVILVVLRKAIPSFEDEKTVETMVVCILIKAGLSVNYVVLYTWGAEMFPSTIRGTALGLSLALGRMAGLVNAPLISLSEDVFGVNAMVGCAATAVLVFPVLIWLPETLNQKVE